MSRFSIYRCKQCGAIINDADDIRIQEKTFDGLFSLKNDVCFINPFKLDDMAIVHRCDPQTIGLCEFIGWKEIEE